MRRLLIRPGAIGDLIVSLPVLEGFHAEYLEVWVAEQNVPLIRFADAVHSIGSTGLDMLQFQPSPRLLERLRSFDSIVSWYGANQPEFRETVGRLGLPFQFVEQALACSNKINLVPPPTVREDFAVIHPFASNPRKRWPLKKFREVADLLQMPVHWCAGPEEELPGAVRIANLYDLACWLARARVYIGNDSGISHLAAAAGTPTIVLFGPTDPAVWAPQGSRVLYPMDKIEPADVIAVVEALI